MTPKVKLIFESELRMEDGRPFTISKNFTASLHPKAKLAEFLGKWRGRPIVPGETIDLGKLLGACCTLVISHQQNMVGRTYASIDAVSKPTKRLAASGHYDPVLARQRIEEWKGKVAAGQKSEIRGQKSGGNQLTPDLSPRGGEGAVPLNPVAAVFTQAAGSGRLGEASLPPKSGAPGASRTRKEAPAATADFDPEVGF